MDTRKTEVSKVLVILGHPRSGSFCGALAQAYAESARAAGMWVERLDLADLAFDPSVRCPAPEDQPLEPDLQRAQALLRWADHLVFVYPAWWGTFPALLKGFLDRALTPGFAFRFTDGDPLAWDKLLAGRTAHLWVTMDTPPWVYRFITRQPGHQAMARATLGFCGIHPTFTTAIGPVRSSTSDQRKEWLETARMEAARLPARLRTAHRRARTRAWFRLLRLQFYPMSWVAYTLGALLACRQGALFSPRVYGLGYLCVFLAEALTVMANEWFDQDTDRLNRLAGPFNGGSRVLVSGDLEPASVRRAMAATAILLVAALGALAWSLSPPLRSGSLAVGAISVLAVGYTVPPLKLVYRGLGELDVAFTHSLAAIVCGAVLQGGSWLDGRTWLIGVPLFFATLAAITLSALPDQPADAAVSKRTLAVLLGPRGAALAALICTLLAAATGIAWQRLGLFGGTSGWAVFLALPHGLLLAWAILNHLRRGAPAARMDGLMALALSYLLWFGIIPLIHVW